MSVLPSVSPFSCEFRKCWLQVRSMPESTFPYLVHEKVAPTWRHTVRLQSSPPSAHLSHNAAAGGVLAATSSGPPCDTDVLHKGGCDVEPENDFGDGRFFRGDDRVGGRAV